MARKPRIEVEGGLYHLITRGVDRRDIFHVPQDQLKFISMLSVQKGKLPFYLYAYCLMTNHVHLLIERMTDDIGRIMHRVLTGYTQYYNRKYRRSGHLLQGRHKAILCQSENYLTELVRYIHLNPVRAKMVKRPEQYPFSSHREYLGLEPHGIADIDPVMRRFAKRKAVARARFSDFVNAGAKAGSDERFYRTDHGILGTEEFVDDMIHRIGEFDTGEAAVRRRSTPGRCDIDLEELLRAVEAVCDVPREELCGSAKRAKVVRAREALIVSGRRLGASITSLSRRTGLSIASVSRRYDAARQKMLTGDGDLPRLTQQIVDRIATK